MNENIKIFNLFFKSLIVSVIVLVSLLILNFTLLSFAQNSPDTEPEIVSNSCNLNDQLIWDKPFEPGWENAFKAKKFYPGNTRQVINDTNLSESYLKVFYPENSVNPGNPDHPAGGTGFLAPLDQPLERACLSYNVRFNDDFDFVKGGKLPGMYGGTANSGGHKADGTDGFSTRYMWQSNGGLILYAYLADNTTDFGRGFNAHTTFHTDRWYNLTQEVILNTPGMNNGSVRVWVDGDLRINATELNFRTIPELKIDGLFFSTFFGGNDQAHAATKDESADFYNFQMFALSDSTPPASDPTPGQTNTPPETANQGSDNLNIQSSGVPNPVVPKPALIRTGGAD